MIEIKEQARKRFPDFPSAYLPVIPAKAGIQCWQALQVWLLDPVDGSHPSTRQDDAAECEHGPNDNSRTAVLRAQKLGLFLADGWMKTLTFKQARDRLRIWSGDFGLNPGEAAELVRNHVVRHFGPANAAPRPAQGFHRALSSLCSASL